MNFVTGALENVFGMFYQPVRHPMVDAANGYVNGQHMEHAYIPMSSSVSDTVLRPVCPPRSSSSHTLGHPNSAIGPTADALSESVKGSRMKSGASSSTTTTHGHKRQFEQLQVHHGAVAPVEQPRHQTRPAPPTENNARSTKRQRVHEGDGKPKPKRRSAKTRPSAVPFRTEEETRALAYWITILVLDTFDTQLKKHTKLTGEVYVLIGSAIHFNKLNPETSIVLLAPYYLQSLVNCGYAEITATSQDIEALSHDIFRPFMLSLNFASTWLDETKLHPGTMASWMDVDRKTYVIMERQALTAIDHNLAFLAKDWDSWLEEIQFHLDNSIFSDKSRSLVTEMIEKSRTERASWQLPNYPPLSNPVVSSVFLDGALRYTQVGPPPRNHPFHAGRVMGSSMTRTPSTSSTFPYYGAESQDITVQAARNADPFGVSSASVVPITVPLGSYLHQGINTGTSYCTEPRPYVEPREEDIVVQRQSSSLFSDDGNARPTTSESNPSSFLSGSSNSLSSVTCYCEDCLNALQLRKNFPWNSESHSEPEETDFDTDSGLGSESSDSVSEDAKSDIAMRRFSYPAPVPVPVPVLTNNLGLGRETSGLPRLLLSRQPLPKDPPVDDSRLPSTIVDPSSSQLPFPFSTASNMNLVNPPRPPLRLPYSSESYLAPRVYPYQAIGNVEAQNASREY
ncbi:hypothetical protein K435DRAFT_839232 [Dendrothele bispora CBS 962.96]|uniref:Uncharacterized protein n=1 Tax=Dendrothele bispora (strain CBS 962.96) TaxID=1314807 RepID=A0A4V4HFS6_DENBC|nr:hypothetical protein K435DRAFT_839232 [Dendrothele bispora CBS 962.96]